MQPYEEMQVWDGVTGSRISFDWSGEAASSKHTPTIATMTENANLVRAMLSHVGSQLGNTTIFSSTTVAAINNGVNHEDGPDLSSWPVLTLASSSSSEGSSKPSNIAARLLVGADGINSPVRSFAGISTDGWDYNRHGVVATLNLGDIPSKRVAAYQRFLPGLGGPVAFLPLPRNRATLVWSTTVENAAYLKSLPLEAFTNMVNAAFRLSMTDLNYMLNLPPSTSAESPSSGQHGEELAWRLQHTSVPSHIPPLVDSVQPKSVASFPLRFRHTSTYISPRIALVGDAAHVIHPLAGQGLNLGIGDVESLFKTLEYAIQHGMDIGDLLSLESYTAARWIANAKVGGVCDLLHKVYNVPGNGPIAWGRSFGLDIIDRSPPLKDFLMRQAAGI